MVKPWGEVSPAGGFLRITLPCSPAVVDSHPVFGVPGGLQQQRESTMGWLSKIFSSIGVDVINSVGKVVDDLDF